MAQLRDNASSKFWHRALSESENRSKFEFSKMRQNDIYQMESLQNWGLVLKSVIIRLRVELTIFSFLNFHAWHGEFLAHYTVHSITGATLKTTLWESASWIIPCDMRMNLRLAVCVLKNCPKVTRAHFSEGWFDVMFCTWGYVL